MCSCSRNATGSTCPSSTPAASVPSWQWKKARPARAFSKKLSAPGGSNCPASIIPTQAGIPCWVPAFARTNGTDAPRHSHARACRGHPRLYQHCNIRHGWPGLARPRTFRKMRLGLVGCDGRCFHRLLQRRHAILDGLLHLFEGAHLNLAHALARHAELGCKLLEGDRVISQSPGLEDAPLALIENVERGDERLVSIVALLALGENALLA